MEAGMIEEYAERGHAVAESRERFAHAHEHDIGDAPLAAGLEAELAVGEPHLADDLRRAEIAVEALLRGRAKGAVEHATDLRGDAQRAALRLGNEHHFEGLRRVGAQQPLARAVGRLPGEDDLGQLDARPRAQLRAKILGQVGHLIESLDATLVQPMLELARAIGPRSQTQDPGLEFTRRQTQQVDRRIHAQVLGHSSVPLKKKPISRTAVSAAAEPCTTLASMLCARSARRVPGASYFGSVAPMMSRLRAIASSPSSTCAITGPELMYRTRSR